jgi:hypothetical protein
MRYITGDSLIKDLKKKVEKYENNQINML